MKTTKTQSSAPRCVFCGRDSGVQFAVFNPRFAPFGTACVECEASLPPGTPGPWYVGKTGNHQGLVIAEKTGANVAVAYDKADAPILAAAPQMLVALTELERCTRQFIARELVTFPAALLPQVREIIAIAGGEA